MSDEMTSSDMSFVGDDPLLAALGQLSPAHPQIDRDRLMFLAGRASAEDPEPQCFEAGGQEPVPSRRYSVLRTQSSPHRTSPRSSRGWPAATAMLAATSLALAIALVTRPAPEPKFVFLDRPVPTATRAPTQQDWPQARRAAAPVTETAAPRLTSPNYLQTRDVALRMGLDALGSPPYSAGSSAPASYRDLLLVQVPGAGATLSTALSQ